MSWPGGRFVKATEIEWSFGISTPWGNSEIDQKIWGDTIQQDSVIYSKKFLKSVYSDYKNWKKNREYKKKIGKQRYKEEQRQKTKDYIFGDNLDDMTKEKMKKEKPLYYTIIYEDFPHRLNDYRELEKLTKDWRDLNALIEHIKKQKGKIKNKFAREKFEEYIDDLEHIRDYQKEMEEKERQDNLEKAEAVTLTTLSLATLAILAKIASMLAGVPM